MATRKSTTKSDSPVAARDQLAAQEPTDSTKQLQQTAKDQEKQQAQELKEGKASTSAERRAASARQRELDRGNKIGGWKPGQKPLNGFTDQLTRRHGNEAIEGHFVTVDLNHKGVPDAMKEAGDSYAVYLEPGDINPDNGYPETIVVRARSATNARYTIPYEAASHSEAGGRV